MRSCAATPSRPGHERAKGLDEHAALMMKFPGMAHEAPYTAHVGPDKKEGILWTFNRPGSFDFACLMAGRYQAGMAGMTMVFQIRAPALLHTVKAGDKVRFRAEMAGAALVGARLQSARSF